MKKLLLIIAILYSSISFAQRNIGPDTIQVMLYYSDTACYIGDDVASIFNSNCERKTCGYLVIWMYSTEILWFDKKPLPKSIKYWFYKPLKKDDWGPFTHM